MGPRQSLILILLLVAGIATGYYAWDNYVITMYIATIMMYTQMFKIRKVEDPESGTYEKTMHVYLGESMSGLAYDWPDNIVPNRWPSRVPDSAKKILFVDVPCKQLEIVLDTLKEFNVTGGRPSPPSEQQQVFPWMIAFAIFSPFIGLLYNDILEDPRLRYYDTAMVAVSIIMALKQVTTSKRPDGSKIGDLLIGAIHVLPEPIKRGRNAGKFTDAQTEDTECWVGMMNRALMNRTWECTSDEIDIAIDNALAELNE